MRGSNEQSSPLRFGHVTEYDASRHMAKVSFPDMGIVSGWLPVLTHNTLNNHDETHLDIGEHVSCLMAGTGTESGIVLGAFYDDKNKPPVHDPDIRSITFGDGTRITYDRKAHELTITGREDVTVKAGSVKISADSIKLSAGTIDLDGAVTCPGYCRC